MQVMDQSRARDDKVGYIKAINQSREIMLGMMQKITWLLGILKHQMCWQCPTSLHCGIVNTKT
jgi:hypothetical protein